VPLCCAHLDPPRCLPVLGPFWTNDEYLVVADFRQRYLYQLKPESDEVRAILMSPCSPVSLAFDSSINGIYVICYEKIPNSDRYKYRIRKKTFDDKINEAIYNAPEGKEHCHIYTVVKILIKEIHSHKPIEPVEQY